MSRVDMTIEPIGDKYVVRYNHNRVICDDFDALIEEIRLTWNQTDEEKAERLARWEALMKEAAIKDPAQAVCDSLNNKD
jgi:hypothetical protein